MSVRWKTRFDSAPTSALAASTCVARACVSSTRIAAPASYRERMQQLEERLDPAQFSRVHRSAIGRLHRIDTLLRDAGGDYAVRLKGGAQLNVSRNRIEALEAWMGISKPAAST